MFVSYSKIVFTKLKFKLSKTFGENISHHFLSIIVGEFSFNLGSNVIHSNLDVLYGSMKL